MYVADYLKDWNTQAKINDKWVLARPLPYYGWYGFKIRIADAYQVLIGRADAVRWIG
jgi:hypothetical protein